VNQLAEKAQIIQKLGIRELLLPMLISDALYANDRVKYYQKTTTTKNKIKR
jgi:hypothetical protein